MGLGVVGLGENNRVAGRRSRVPCPGTRHPAAHLQTHHPETHNDAASQSQESGAGGVARFPDRRSGMPGATNLGSGNSLTSSTSSRLPIYSGVR